MPQTPDRSAGTILCSTILMLTMTVIAIPRTRTSRPGMSSIWMPIATTNPPERRQGITTVLVFAMLLLAALPIANSRASSFGDWFWSHVPGEPSAQPSGLTWCPGVSSVDKKRIDLGAEQMRRTTEWESLLDNLVDRHIYVALRISFTTADIR